MRRRLLHSLRPRPRQRGGCLVDGDRCPAAPAPSLQPAPRRAALRAVSRARPLRLRANATGTTTSETNGAAAMPSATAVCPLAMPSATAIAKQMRDVDSISTSAAEQAEALVSGQPAAREVARRISQRADDEHVVERALAFEHVVHQLARAAPARPPGRSARSSPGSASARASPCCGAAARAAFGDRAREQLFDRPIDHRDDHEHHRPQNVEPLRRFFAEHVAGDREVRERQQAGRGDPDRQDPRAAAVGALRAGAF